MKTLVKVVACVALAGCLFTLGFVGGRVVKEITEARAEAEINKQIEEDLFESMKEAGYTYTGKDDGAYTFRSDDAFMSINLDSGEVVLVMDTDIPGYASYAIGYLTY